MRITCGSCGASVDTNGAPHVCANDVTVARGDMAPTEVRLPVVPPVPDRPLPQSSPEAARDPHVPSRYQQPQYAPQYTPQYGSAAVVARRSGPGALVWFVAGVGVMLVVVAAAVVLLGRSGGDEAADVAGRTVVTDAAVVESAVTQPAAAATAPAVTQPAAAATAPAVTQPATTSAPVLPSATWNGVYVIEPPVGPLLIGHKGRRVDALQLALVRRGYLSPPVDGDYGPATEAAVVRFQYDSGLVVDGVAGPATLAALGIA